MSLEAHLVSSVNSIGGVTPDTFKPGIHVVQAQFVVGHAVENLPRSQETVYLSYRQATLSPQYKEAIGGYLVERVPSVIPGREMIQIEPNIDAKTSPFVRIRYRREDNRIISISRIGPERKIHVGRFTLPGRRKKQVLWRYGLS